MEFKTPTKKGFKTPRDRPPLPMLNDSFSGFCVEEYDWPLFSGYYNGTSVIVDDPQAMNLLTNKGFFGKGSLSRGCLNLSKRKIPTNVVYESQWKRRKMWIESLSTLLESKEKSKQVLKDNDEEVYTDIEKMEDENEKNGSQQINSFSTEEKSSKKGENEGDESSKNKVDETYLDNIADTDKKKSNELEKKKIANENKNAIQTNPCKTEELPTTNRNEESKNETSRDNIINVDEKSNDVELMNVNNENNSSLQEDSCKTEEDPSISGYDDDKQSKNNSKETSQGNKVNQDNDNKLDEESSKTSGNEGDGQCKVSYDTDAGMKQSTKEPDQEEISESNKNEKESKNDEVIGANDETIEELNKNKVTDNQSECVGKINLSINTEKGILNVNEVLVIPDIKGELEQYFLDLKPHIEEEKVKTAIEVLYLSLEEAFFLSYACNCLQIFDLTSNVLPFRDMWVLFQESQPDFIEKYVAYHYFRAKGWVVKSGTKFGGDFLLYKKGPLYFHSSYIVKVEVLKNYKNSRNKTIWRKIVGMNRMAESANKEILICHVLWPDLEEKEFSNPGILKKFRVSETLLRRWQATHEKTPEIK